MDVAVTPSEATVRGYMTTAGLQALKTMEQTKLPNIDKISKNFLLNSTEFRELADSPLQQALFLHIHARLVLLCWRRIYLCRPVRAQ